MDIKKKNAGFTLIELLVVVFIIGIVLGLARLNFNRDLDNIAHSEAKRYARVLSYTKEYSAYNGRILSLRLDKTLNTYFFLYIDPLKQNWNRLSEKTGSKLLSPHIINRRIKVIAQKSKPQSSEDQPDNYEQEESSNNPRSLEIARITPFSDFEPLSLILSGETRDYVVTTDEFDDVKIQIQ